jgi:hypothetical protein
MSHAEASESKRPLVVKGVCFTYDRYRTVMFEGGEEKVAV